ncbi:hypothetical protein [Micromonospora sp. WMMD736]|uniref:hypothetical protein n=1 Tax=Micromonospora sp. WMMD736 TaxID=3404112 RepID=UPI003B94EC58
MRTVIACLVAVGLLVAAPQAAADPDDLVPFCGAGETQADDGCRPPPQQRDVVESWPGANPDLPVGTNPGSQPVVG